MRRFEFVDGKSSKFWEVDVARSTVTVRFGRIGSDGTTQTKEYASPEAAAAAADKLVRGKSGKGYVEVGATNAAALDGARGARVAAKPARAGKPAAIRTGQALGLWDSIDAALARGADPNKPEPYRRRLADVLAALDDAALGRFLGELRGANAALFTRAHWVAASLLLGRRASDQEFEDFRAWLVGHGRDVFERVRAQPDAVAELAVPGAATPAPFLKALVGGPWKAYESRKRPKPIDAARERWSAGVPKDLLDHIGWYYWAKPDVAELERGYPRTWSKHGAQWGKATDDAFEFEGFVTEADVPRLGKVRIGDTLARRGSGDTFVVLGITDDGAGVISSEGPGEGRYTARVREKDGCVRCGQGLSGRYQRWPHEPDTGYPGARAQADRDAAEDDAEAAAEACAAAIQKRVKKALGNKARVQYSAYEDDADGLPIDNLDDVAYEGDIRFVEKDTSDGERFESDVLSNPTWLDLARVANDMILALGYEDHVFLEGFRVMKKTRGAPATGKLEMGS